MTEMSKHKHRVAFYYWIPSLYLFEGFYFALVTIVSLIMYKSFNVDNATITVITSLFTLPWLFKPVIAPLIESMASKRTFVLVMPLIIMACMLILFAMINQPHFIFSSIILFLIIGLAAAVYDLNADGLYLTLLDLQAQAKFIGIRTLSYQAGKLICQAGLIWIVSLLMTTYGIKASWQIMLVIAIFFILIISIYHYQLLQGFQGHHEVIMSQFSPIHHARQIIAEFIQLPHLAIFILFILLYPLAENQLIKIVPLFLMDGMNHGGLGLDLNSLSFIYSTLGVISMVSGIMLSSYIFAKYSLSKTLIPITIFVTLTNIGYFILAFVQIANLVLIGMIIVLAQFGFGLSNGAYMVILSQYFSRRSHSMSLYAIGTAFMGLSVFIGGAISGYMQTFLGYTGFFVWILIMGVIIIGLTVYVGVRLAQLHN